MGSVLGNLERISFFVCGHTLGKLKDRFSQKMVLK